MNTKLIKFYLKDDIKVTTVYMLGLSIIIYTIGLMVDSMPGFSVYVGAINNGFPFVAFGYFAGVYFTILNKTASEQWENFSLTKDEKYNLLAIRYIVSMLIPQTILVILSGYLNNEMSPDVFWSFAPWILLPTLNFVFSTYFTLVSGNMVTSVLGIAFAAIISEVIIEKQVENSININPSVLWICTLIFVCVMFFVNKKIFRQREVEKLGKMYLFRWAEVIFTIGVAALVATVVNGIVMNNGTSTVDYMFITFITTMVYAITDTLIITSLKVENLKIMINRKKLLIQCFAGVVISILVPLYIAI